MSRRTVHELVDRIPEQELLAAQRYLEFLSYSPAYRASHTAPVDDEPITQGDAAAIERAIDEVKLGKVASHEDVLREFGLR